MGNLIFAMFSCLSGIGFALYSGPIFALCCLGYVPIFAILLSTLGLVVKKQLIQRQDAVKELGGVVSETLQAIKMVIAFGGEDIEKKKMEKCILQTEQIGKKQQIVFGSMQASIKTAIFMYYTYTFFLGGLFVVNQKEKGNGDVYVAEDVIAVLIAFITGFISLVAALPSVQALMAAKVAAKSVFKVIDREPRISNSEVPLSSVTLKEAIKFHNVSFKYVNAPKEAKPTLNTISFEIKAGETTAIIGASGLGKSTIVQLVERFYDPTSGGVFFDDVNIKDIDLRVLRENIGYVSQEPHLIIGTIRENLLLGNKDATEEELNQVIMKANAGFVFTLEKKLDTFVGSTSMMNLSGGQKQRLAIARALIKNPKILILDEATSALDSNSEKEVQEAIEKISQQDSKITIIIIAHRLSTI